MKLRPENLLQKPILKIVLCSHFILDFKRNIVISDSLFLLYHTWPLNYLFSEYLSCLLLWPGPNVLDEKSEISAWQCLLTFLRVVLCLHEVLKLVLRSRYTVNWQVLVHLVEIGVFHRCYCFVSAFHWLAHKPVIMLSFDVQNELFFIFLFRAPWNPLYLF